MTSSLLQGVKLKKTGFKEKEINLKSDLSLEQTYNSRLRAVDLESWYHKIAKFTYPTEFIELTPLEAQTMMEESRKMKKEASDWTQNKILISLKQKLENALKTHSMDEVFVKLSSRSPKDSRATQQRAQQLALERLRTLQKQRKLTTNDLVVAIMTTGIEVLKMTSASQIIETFLTSDRVCEDDIPLALQFPDKWSQHIVIRRWIDVPIQYEFRGFVLNNKLTALSQYYTSAYFPDIIENKEKILKLVLNLFEQVKDLLDMKPPEYVIDFAVQVKEEKAYVIELNPFGKPNGLGTGTCLFDNSKEEDLQVLFGDREFEFRVEEAATSVDANKYIRGEWRTFFQQHGLI